MKHIGIVDVTTVGACICVNEIVKYAVKSDVSDDHPEFSINSLSFKRYKDAVNLRDLNLLTSIILESISKLQTIGADFIIIPSNTPHYCFNQLIKVSPLPILNLIELSAIKCQKNKYQKVLILGTNWTVHGGLYNEELNKRNIEVIIAPNSINDKINDLIINQIIPYKIQLKSVDAIAEAINDIDCDAIILACTELPEVFNSHNIFKPLIDTTRLLAHSAVDYAKSAAS